VLVEPLGALLAKRPVADGQGLVDEQDLRGGGGGYSEVQPGPHTRRVGLHPHVDGVTQAGELDHRRQQVFDGGPVQTLGQQTDLDVAPSGQLVAEHGLHAEEGWHRPDPNFPGRDRKEPGGGLQHRGFARAVGADHAHALAYMHVECDSSQGVDLLGGWPVAAQQVADEWPM